ncbi:hypothetical protein JCM11251_004682 [Rhodosporidiobolus azoricus]
MSATLNQTLAGIDYKGPINPDPGPGESAIVIFGYVPSESLASIALLAFGLVFFNHLSWMIRHKTTRVFYGLFLFGNACEIVGYAARLRAHFKPFVVNLFIVQYFFIVVSPVFYQAALYIAFAQALRRLDHYGSTLLRFEPRILMWVMVVADVITTIIQVVGAALIGVSESARFRNESMSLTSDQANDILLAGLAIQTFSFLAFIILLGLCIVRSARTFTAAHLPKGFSVLIFLSAFLLLLRTTFRLAETAQGVFGPAASKEALFGTLEFFPVIMAISLWAAMPLEETLPIDVDDEPRDQDTSLSGHTFSMQQTKSMQLGRTSSRGSRSPREGSRERERERRRRELDDGSPVRGEERDLENSPSGSMDKTASEGTSTGTEDGARMVEQRRPLSSRASSVLRTGMVEDDPIVLERTRSQDSRMSLRKLRN